MNARSQVVQISGSVPAGGGHFRRFPGAIHRVRNAGAAAVEILLGESASGPRLRLDPDGEAQFDEGHSALCVLNPSASPLAFDLQVAHARPVPFEGGWRPYETFDNRPWGGSN